MICLEGIITCLEHEGDIMRLPWGQGVQSSVVEITTHLLLSSMNGPDRLPGEAVVFLIDCIWQFVSLCLSHTQLNLRVR